MLELDQHDAAAFVTLTYDDAHVPPTLRKTDLSGYLKRLREDVAPRRVRFFASGEYGDRFGRPHYHAILFGLHPQRDADAIRRAWGLARRTRTGWEHRSFGMVHVGTVTPRSVAYVAGYVTKKYAVARSLKPEERVDPETGEVYEFQPPFTLASRGGRSGVGLGGVARDRFPESWKYHAILGGARIGVPRYLFDGFARQASPETLEAVKQERLALVVPRTRDELRQSEKVAEVRHHHAETRRSRHD